MKTKKIVLFMMLILTLMYSHVNAKASMKKNPIIKRIILKGNSKTKDFVILKELAVKEGQVLNIKKLRKGLERVYKLDYFQEIKPKIKRDANEPDKVDIVLNFKEKKTGTFRMGGGYSSRDGWIGFVNVKEKNLMGNGQKLGFDWKFGGLKYYSLSFYEPWLNGSSTSFGIDLYNKQRKSIDPDKGSYIKKHKGGSITLGHPLTGEWKGSLKFRVENMESDFADNNYQNEAGNMQSLTLQTSRDTTNYLFNPTSGKKDKFSLEYAGQILGGDFDFTKYNLSVKRYGEGFKKNQSWALRIKTGLSFDDLPLLEKYQLGGPESLRGYKIDSFNGNNQFLINLEYRLAFTNKFTGVLFADAGNTWKDIHKINLDLHHSLGAGLRMNTPVGLIRLDYGFNDRGQGMPSFSIGQTF